MSAPNQLKLLIETALASGRTLTCAESCTGGLLAAALTERPGSSAVFEYGFVTYSNAAKQKLLDVQPTTLSQFGAVSEQVVREMATGAIKASGADLSVAISGIAGPGGSDHKPEGRVCFATASTSHDSCLQVFCETVEFGALGRENVRLSARDHAIQLLLNALKPGKSLR